MHQVQIALKLLYTMKCLSIHNPLYCALNLMAFGKVKVSLKQAMHKILDDKFRVTYTRPDPANHQWSKSIVELLLIRDDPEDISRARNTLEVGCKKETHDSREKQAAELLEVFNGNWQDVVKDTDNSEVLHHCLACCKCNLDPDPPKKAKLRAHSLVLWNRQGPRYTIAKASFQV